MLINFHGSDALVLVGLRSRFRPTGMLVNGLMEPGTFASVPNGRVVPSELQLLKSVTAASPIACGCQDLQATVSVSTTMIHCQLRLESSV